MQCNALTEADKQRIEGREWAEEVMEEVKKSSEDFQIGFWRCVKKIVKEDMVEEESKKRPMNDEESRRFGLSRVEFGQYRGKVFDEVPLDYLEWLVGKNDEVAKYVNSRRVQAELGNE
jgi:hypothetical protein